VAFRKVTENPLIAPISEGVQGMNQPLVTVFMAAYNGERYIRQALDSALAQTYPRMEVVVVNDGSTDSTPRILAEYGDRIQWFTQPNAGQASARNLAVSHARGEWVAMLDQDDLWDPPKIERQVAAIRSGDALIHCNARIIDASGQIILVDMPRADAETFATLVELLTTKPPLAPTVLIRKEAYNSVGGFDPANRFGTEDYQLWLRLAAQGYRFRFVDEVLASYRVHGNNMSGDPWRQALGGFYAIRRTRREYPGAFGLAERRACRRRLSQIEFDLAWHLYDHGEYGRAWRHFCLAIWHRPSNWGAWAHAAVTSLPLRSHLVPLLRPAVTGRGSDQPEGVGQQGGRRINHAD
jgi:glycosyltransferase involved in cell wall biosynthesis